MRWAVLAALLLGACGSETAAPEAAWIDDVEQPLPEWLSETGLYADLPSLTPSDAVVEYVPPYPLWSNGADKARLLHLPPGKRIETGDDGGFRFPVGTVIAKAFGYPGIEGRDDAEVSIETRVLYKRESGWSYAVYHWNRENTEAQLVTGDPWPERDLQLEDASGTGRTDPYVIPGKLDCRACHETHRQVEPVIGIDPLNFDPKLAPLFATPPRTVPLPAKSEAEAAAMGYVLGNCTHCHHGVAAKGDNAAFSLLPDVLRQNTINQMTASSASGMGIRVVPGDPEESAVYEAVVHTREPGYAGDFKPMPPVGITRVDPRAAEVLGAWIRSLGAE
jgi:hypothetical protein